MLRLNQEKSSRRSHNMISSCKPKDGAYTNAVQSHTCRQRLSIRPPACLSSLTSESDTASLPLSFVLLIPPARQPTQKSTKAMKDRKKKRNLAATKLENKREWTHDDFSCALFIVAPSGSSRQILLVFACLHACLSSYLRSSSFSILVMSGREQRNRRERDGRTGEEEEEEETFFLVSSDSAVALTREWSRRGGLTTFFPAPSSSSSSCVPTFFQ